MTNVIPLRPLPCTPAMAADILRQFDDIYHAIEIVSDALKTIDLPDDVAHQVRILLAEARLAIFRANAAFIGRTEWSD